MTANSPSISWFHRARYGMFIHWGPYSVLGRGEWVINRENLSKEEYTEDAVNHFHAEHYDPVAWANLAKESGMGYVILTTRHHDGFCLWDTETTDFNAARIGPKRDLIRPFVEAVRSAGLKVGFYFSVADWFHPDYPGAHCRDWPDSWPDENARLRFVDFYSRQLEELMCRYGTIDLLWYDGCIPMPTDGSAINSRIKQLQPNILINNRNGEPWDFHCCEQTIRPSSAGVPWEACMTLNENWAFHAGDANWKSARQVVRMLVETTANAGNLLLNVGPRADGSIPEGSTTSLREAGAWLKRNSDFLSNSERSPYSWSNWGRITVKANEIFLHIFHGTGSELRVADIKNRVVQARLLDGNLALPFEQKDGLVWIRDLPKPLPDEIATTVVLKVEGTPETLNPQTSFWIPGE